jgi:DNA invertase Pin-like site-specific DNA recombinase
MVVVHRLKGDRDGINHESGDVRPGVDDEQVDGTSLDVQRESCLRVIEQRGREQVAVFADEDVSGVLASRPSLDRLIEACRRDELDVVVVARLDRFGRSLRHLLTTLGRSSGA